VAALLLEFATDASDFLVRVFDGLLLADRQKPRPRKSERTSMFILSYVGQYLKRGNYGITGMGLLESCLGNA